MSKSYRLPLQINAINPLIKDDHNHEYAVAVFHWLIQELRAELKDELQGIELEVIRVIFKEISEWPWIGIVIQPTISESDLDRLEALVETTAESLLQKRPVSELIKFMGESNKDWKAITAEIMSGK